MSKHENIRQRILNGTGIANIQFEDVCGLLRNLGFREKTTKSSHLIFRKDGIPTIINLQRGRDGKAKPYQIRQVRAVILSNNL